MRALLAFMCELIKTVTDFKERAMYDTLSLNLIKLNIFPSLVKIILATPQEEVDYGKVARVFELCACHTEGITIIQKHLDAVVAMCDTFMLPTNDII